MAPNSHTVRGGLCWICCKASCKLWMPHFLDGNLPDSEQGLCKVQHPVFVLPVQETSSCYFVVVLILVRLFVQGEMCNLVEKMTPPFCNYHKEVYSVVSCV